MTDNLKISVKGREIDLGAAFPMTLGDWKQLEKGGILDKDGKASEQGACWTAKLLHFFIHKVDPDITVDDLDELPLSVVNRVATGIQKMMEEGDEPDPNS